MSKQTSIYQFFGKSNQTPKNQQQSNQSSSKKTNDGSKENFKPAKRKFGLYDIVWALLDGFPYWPAIICDHPTKKTFFKNDKGKEWLNVQFFDRPPQRSWIKVDNCLFFENEKHPRLAVINDAQLKDAIEWATEALDVDKQERARLIVPSKESDDEDTELMNSDADEQSPLNKSTRINKRKFELESDDDEDSTQSTFKKSKISKILTLDSDSEDDYKPGKNDDTMTSESVMSNELMSDEFSEDEFVDDESLDDIANTPIKNKSSSSRSKKSTTKTKKFNAESNGNNNATSSGGDRKWQHLTLDFLQPENIRDKNGRRPDDPNYDPKTLLVPDQFFKKQTSTQKQWWDMKRDYYDTILFFKMGKFYELFHFDAVIVCEITNIIYMKGDWAHCGFPEKAYQKFANQLIDLGYKVARVEQTETADARDRRTKDKKGEKVVRREVCRITSKGTRSFNEMVSVADDPYSSFILAITEKVLEGNQVLTGLCFIDTSIGEFHIGQLVDDKYSSLLRTVFSHYPPVEILLDKDNVTNQTLQTIKSCLPNTSINYLKTGTEFWIPRETLKFLFEGPFFKVLSSETEKEELIIPEKLKELLDPSDILNLTAKKEYELAMKAFGAIVYQLKRNLIEEELLALKRFNIFDTNFLLTKNKNEDKDFMVLDSVTIKNLELFENSIGGRECTLLNTIDTCVTKFGKRRLRKWLCSPLNIKKDIDDRLSAVTELMKLSLNDLRNDLKILPDLERILLKIHTQSLSNRSKNHPDSRAVFMEALSMNKLKINEFCKLLDSFRHCDRFVKEIRNQLSNEDTESEFLLRLINYKENNGMFPNCIEVLKFFDNAFDHKIAKEKGIINPRRGVNKDYEKAEENIKRIENSLENHLKNLKREYNCKSLKFTGNGKNRYQIEFPDSILAGKNFEKTSQRKGFNRYQDQATKNFISELKIYEAHKEEAMQDCWRMILQAFMEHKDDWSNIIMIIAILDCLISLAQYANTLKTSGTICKPTILDQENKIIRFKDGKHPSLTNIEFIPNSLDLNNKLMLLSGSNMSGKSTLMRQTGLMVLLAHIGSYLPASEFQCTIVDRIFTRLGATDRILEGESTFYVELSETSTIIKNATTKSLVLLDELGRGTSSVDGTAIAGSVVDYLSTKICCISMFSTHYSTLMEEFKLAENVRFGHMACCVENEDLKNVTNESITFLYKLVEGISPKSHGFHAAKLSGIPDDVIQTGYNKAQELNNKIESFKLLTKLINNENMNVKQMRLLLDYIVD